MKVPKAKVLEFFGGTAEHVAVALGMTGQGVRAWADPLPRSAVGLVVLAGLEKRGLAETRRAFPSVFPKK